MGKRQQILEAIQSRLESMTAANGYAFGLGQHVSYFQDFPEEYGGPPAITFYDEEEDCDEVGSMHERRLQVRIDAIAYMQSNAIAESSQLLADVIRAIGQDRQWGGAAINTTLNKNTKELETLGRRACRVTQEILIIYRVEAFEG